MKKYEHNKIEKKWQRYWEAKKTFVAKDSDKRPKKYILDMFPYPSGAGLHVGHPEGYTATDILSRYSRMKGFNVLHPMGWDAFGLPAENYAIKEGVHPQKTTQKNIKRFTQQIKAIGLSYDWTREVNTSDPGYYKWTQWLFLQFYKKGLAYKKEASVNWCPKDNTVLANEQVVNGKCERCGTEVVQKNLSQWFFKITDYAEELLSSLETLDWPDPIKLMQRNWIGKSQGAEIDFPLGGQKPNFLILHCKGGSPDAAFYPSLKKELEILGFDVQIPALPNPDAPDAEEQAAYVLKNCKINKNTVIVGHSSGGLAALRLVEGDVQVSRLILIATPYSGKFLDGKKRPTVTHAAEKGFNFNKIKSNVRSYTVFSDTGDYAVPVADGESFAKQLGVSPNIIKAAKPHFSASEEPELFQGVLPIIKVFTTRPDTIFGVTYMVLAPEHYLVKNLKSQITNWQEVEKYISETQKKSELQRTQLEKEKTGVELKGIKAINPATKKEIPIWIADYVITGYGTGAIMAVPAHDERDFEFAKKFNLQIVPVIKPTDIINRSPLESPALSPGAYGHLGNEVELGFWAGPGTLINSGEFNGLNSEEAIAKAASKFGKLTTKYKLRDWLISRQRYWGAPIPIIYCEKCGEQAVPEKDLPVKLPTDVDFRPTGESPLKRSKKFSKVTCPNCGGKAERDYDTMDTFVDSSWYFLRYTDPKNKTKFADQKKIKTWMPVNTYIGGAEHAVLHLLYARFFTKAMHDMKMLDFQEPFLKLRNIGLILGPDGEKMSKSRGNVINPDDVVNEFGADSLRMFEMFMGPLEDAKPWMTNGIIGIRRFLDRIWFWANDLSSNKKFSKDSEKTEKQLHKLIKKITEDIEQYHFNTAVSSFMQFHNEIKDEPISLVSMKSFLKLLYPFAPHMSEELFQILGGKKSLQLEVWPEFNPEKTVDSTVEIVVQVNGKVKGKMSLARESKQDAVQAEAIILPAVQQLLTGQTIKRVVFVPGKLINLVI